MHKKTERQLEENITEHRAARGQQQADPWGLLKFQDNQCYMLRHCPRGVKKYKVEEMLQ